ncbi:hypothetical protein IWZ00DRAFT_280007 [Phyllosticta capitalensis]|uniref:Uncharacterized protein n=1 Tax=Phyllosticta capitalensis TaxID=121624 RepID=A0ABR1YQB8_9PEZI
MSGWPKGAARFKDQARRRGGRKTKPLSLLSWSRRNLTRCLPPRCNNLSLTRPPLFSFSCISASVALQLGRRHRSPVLPAAHHRPSFGASALHPVCRRHGHIVRHTKTEGPSAALPSAPDGHIPLQETLPPPGISSACPRTKKLGEAAPRHPSRISKDPICQARQLPSGWNCFRRLNAFLLWRLHGAGQHPASCHLWIWLSDEGHNKPRIQLRILSLCLSSQTTSHKI